VPRAIPLARPVARPVLGCGALLKNTFCLAVGDSAWLGPHIGDLENLETYESFIESIDRLERFLGVRPEIAAHDLHPQYLSTRYALERRGVLTVAVQHHHAHIASAMAEHGLNGPVIGVAFDGTGLGTDGAAWGGEVLIADFGGFERFGTLRPIPLAGGDAAIRAVWRIALAVADDAFDGRAPIESLGVFAAVPHSEIEVVRRMVAQRVNAPLAHGAGRYFDALGAMGLGRAASRFEGQVALAWNVAADPDERRPYGFAIDAAVSPRQVDLRPMVREAVADLLRGSGPAVVSARFHCTLAQAAADLVRAAAVEHGRLPVVLSGGCFQNPRLTEDLVAALEPDFDVCLHRNVPPGDGGIALGQVVIADAMRRILQA
jgi:hydrogenase maturation protein HypF